MTENYPAVDPQVPLLLVPMRLETRSAQVDADAWDLRVRIYPDEISLSTLRSDVSAVEAEAAQSWWTQRWSPTVPDPDPAAPETTGSDPWAELVAAVGPGRAPWVAEAMRPTNPGDRGTGDPVFPDPPAPDSAPPPRARLLPDVLRVVVTQSGTTVSQEGMPIPADGVATGSADGDLAALAQSLTTLTADDRAPGEPALDDPLAWVTDFGAAEAVGLGIRVRLPHGLAPIERVTVVGVRTAADPEATATELAAVLLAHRYGSGAALPPVGTVTNNTPDTRAAWSRIASQPGQPALDAPAVEPSVAAGPELTRALGVATSTFAGWDGADHLGGFWSIAMTSALWPVTWGGFLDRVLARPLSGATTEQLRTHLHAVRGRGPLSPVRIGRQPYGLLPVTSLAAYVPTDGTRAGIADVLRRLEPLWRSVAGTVPHVSSGDLDQTLPEILAQTPVSRAVRVRRAIGLGGTMERVAEKIDPDELAARTTLVRIAEAILGLPSGGLGDPTALGVDRTLGLPLADDADPDVLRAILEPGGHTGAHTSVLQVLLDLSTGQTWAALERLIEEERLQIMANRLREAVDQLGAELVDIGLEALDIIAGSAFDGEAERLQRAASAFDSPDVPWSADRFLRRFPVLRLRPHPIDIAAQADAFAVAEAVTITLRAATAYADVRQAISRLTDVPSTSERANLLAETLDCASHRFDAWVTSLATERLAALRARRPTGLAVGAYGVVEDLRPIASRVIAAPPDGIDAGVLEPVRGGGAIAAPSTSHAVTAAVLRGARLTHAPGDEADGALEIDITSTRMRMAMSVLAGVRGGQPLGALLGYRFERDLHEAVVEPGTPDHRLNKYVPSLRTLAPLVAAKSTDRVPDGPAPAALESVATTDVIDGVRLREIYLAERVPGPAGGLAPASPILTRLGQAPPGFDRYGIGAWTPPDDTEVALIVDALERLNGLLDAVSDLLLAEGVHQLVGANAARSAAAMDAIAGDAVPAEPDVLASPASSTAFTHRLLVLSPARKSAPLQGWVSTPRAAADRSLEAWARTALGPAAGVVLTVDGGGAPAVDLSAAGISALDLIAATGGSPTLLWSRLRRAIPDLPGSPLTSRAIGLPTSSLTFGEAWVVAGSLRALLAGSRPAMPADLAPPGEKPAEQRGVDIAELRARAGAAREALAVESNAVDDRAALLQTADGLAAYGLGAGVDPDTLGDRDPEAPAADDLTGHVETLLAERDRRLVAADAAIAAYDAAPTMTADAACLALATVIDAVFHDRLPVLPVLEAAPLADAFTTAWDRPAAQTPDGAVIRPWLSTASRVRPAAARLVETVLLREAFRGRQRLRVVQMAETSADRWIGQPFPADFAPTEAITACVVHAPTAFDPAHRCVGLVVDGWTETVPRHRARPDGSDPLMTAGMAVHANGPDARAPQSLLLAVSPDGEAWTWERVADIVAETVALARARLVTLERAPLGGALLPAIWAQDWSLQGERVFDPLIFAEYADSRAVLRYVSEPGQ